jgi:hypothetical protein
VETTVGACHWFQPPPRPTTQPKWPLQFNQAEDDLARGEWLLCPCVPCCLDTPNFGPEGCTRSALLASPSAPAFAFAAATVNRASPRSIRTILVLPRQFPLFFSLLLFFRFLLSQHSRLHSTNLKGRARVQEIWIGRWLRDRRLGCRDKGTPRRFGPVTVSTLVTDCSSTTTTALGHVLTPRLLVIGPFRLPFTRTDPSSLLNLSSPLSRSPPRVLLKDMVTFGSLRDEQPY